MARFLEREVEPYGLEWEKTGKVPREVLRKMGEAGFFGLMYDSEYGGAEADALTNLVFAEALSQSTYAGFIVSVLVHTDMASPHLHLSLQHICWLALSLELQELILKQSFRWQSSQGNYAGDQVLLAKQQRFQDQSALKAS